MTLTAVIEHPAVVISRNDDGEIVQVLDPTNECGANPPCGGCDRCVIQQAEHYGAELEEYPVERVGIHDDGAVRPLQYVTDKPWCATALDRMGFKR